MKRIGWIATALLALTAPMWAAYSYYVSVPNMTSFNWSQWNLNDTLTTSYFTDNGGYYGLTGSFGSVISNVAVPDSSSDYEVKLKARGDCSRCTIILRGTSNANADGSVGSGYYVQLNSMYLYLYKYVGGSGTYLGSVAVYSGYFPPAEKNLRAVINGSQILVYVDNTLRMVKTDTTLTSGKGGVALMDYTGGSDPPRVSELYIGPLDRTAPNAINSSNISTTSFSNRVDLQWSGLTDDANGTGLASTTVSRNGSMVGYANNVFSDSTVSPATSYTYSIKATDFHGNQTTGSITLTTPASGSIDPRRVGVRATGAYWGAKGEQIDLLSGNLNYTYPLITAQSRGGWSIPINLTYNSQNWRQDGSGAVWNLGRDVGYGYGWKLLAGSLTPYWSDYFTLDHYLLVDSTGAEYRLNVNTSGVWSTSEGLFLRYEESSKRLYFPDGSFWTFGALSGGDEPDAGTSYPTVIEDTNGNQISVAYTPATARILTIEDVRAVSYGGGRQTYSFTYDGSNHLTNITNLTADAAGHTDIEDYTLTYSSAATLTNPFTGATFGSVKMLQTVVASGSLSLTTTFTTDSTGSLTKAVFPAGGYLRWQHSNATYVGSRLQPEVLNRYISADGSTESTYSIARDSGDSSRNVHLYADITDPGGVGKKKWNFDTTSSSFTVGLLLSTEGWQLPGTAVKLLQNDYTWATSGKQTLTSIGTTTNPGANQVKKITSWGYDAYGNVTSHGYGFTLASFPSTSGCCNQRTFTYTYLTDSNYLAKYITNRRVSTSVSGIGNLPTNYTPDTYSSTTLALNYYDNDSTSPCYSSYGSSIPSVSGAYEHDAAYTTSSFYRGNLTGAATLSGVQCAQYDLLGNSSTQLDTVGRVHSSVFSSSTGFNNYAAPNSASMGSYSESATYNTLLDPLTKTDLNGTTTPQYDSFERPSQVTSALGVVTTFAYTISPPTVTATTNGRWVKTTMDGLGRTTLVETGYSSTTVNQAETEYYSNGRVYRTSLPHAPATAARWTTYTYDGLGRTLTVVAADTASTTSYAYLGNAVTITDPAGAWKKYAMDESGNIMVLTEPNPAGGTWDTTYRYNLFGQVKEVKVIRGANTQTRTYTYNSYGQLTQSVTPEQGTTTYAYYSNGLPRYKIDAKGQKVENTYDSQGRLLTRQGYDASSNADYCTTVNNLWDSGVVNGTFTLYAGRLLQQSYAFGSPSSCTTANSYQRMYEYYSYNSNGAITSKTLNSGYGASPGLALKADMTYDSEGRLSTLKYPDTTSGTGATYTYHYNTTLGQLDGMTLGGTNVVSGVSYGAGGELLAMTFGGYDETRTYNNMYQLTRLTDVVTGGGATTVDLKYNFSSTQNNGKITSQEDVVSGETVQYTYDALQRLTLAETTSSAWGQGYVYDGFGNLLQQNVTKGSAPSMSISVSTSTNQVTGGSYDANGNDISGSKAYDTVNHLLTGDGTTRYIYAPDGKRVFKGPGLTGDVFFYLGNQRLGMYHIQYNSGTGTNTGTTVSTNLYFGGRLISSGGTTVLTDRLGSNIGSDLTHLKSYFPYGQEKPSATANNVEKFTGYYRDSETGLDYADQRYHAPGAGRFLSPDGYLPSADAHSSGSWNRYSYVEGDPINRIDPSGNDYCIIGSRTRCVSDDECNIKEGYSTGDLPAPCSEGQWFFAGGPEFVSVTDTPDYLPVEVSTISNTLNAETSGESSSGGDGGGGGEVDVNSASTPKNPCDLSARQRGLMFTSGLINLASAGFKLVAAGAVELGSGGLGTPLAVYGVYTAAGNISTGLVQTVGAFMPNAALWQRGASVTSAVGSVSGLATLFATHGNVTAAASVSRWEGFALLGVKGGTGNPPDPTTSGGFVSSASTLNSAYGQATAGASSVCH